MVKALEYTNILRNNYGMKRRVFIGISLIICMFSLLTQDILVPRVCFLVSKVAGVDSKKEEHLGTRLGKRSTFIITWLKAAM